jgi:hypothetical protein
MQLTMPPRPKLGSLAIVVALLAGCAADESPEAARLAAMTPAELCDVAMNATRSGWGTTSVHTKYVAEAQRRRIGFADCREQLSR